MRDPPPQPILDAAPGVPLPRTLTPSANPTTAEALLRSATALLDADDERELLSGYCQSLVQHLPNLGLVWAWFGPADTQLIQPMVFAGRASDYARQLAVPRNPRAVTGPAYRALAGERVCVFSSHDFWRVGPWDRELEAHGIRTVLALPLRSSVDEQRGILLLYADQDEWFEQQGLGLFDALADLFSAVITRAARHAAMARAATRDALTGLLNRRAVPALAQRLKRHRPDDPDSTVVLLDLDHFKRINDTHGHAAGDQVLHGVAQAMLGGLRQSDTCLRWGGEEFLLVLAGAGLHEALAVMQRLRERLAELPHALPGGPVLQVTASFGMSGLKAGESLEAAINRADQALYAAKRDGRNRIAVA